MSGKVVVLGSGAAGLNAALKLSKKGVNTVLVAEDKHHADPEKLHRTLEKDIEGLSIDLGVFLEDTDVKFVEDEIENIDGEKKVVETSEEVFEYDNLVVALEGDISRPDFSIEYTENFYRPKSAVKAAEKLEDSEKVAVIGSGIKGVQTASYLNLENFVVTLIDERTRPLPRENEEASKKLLNYLNSSGLGFRGGSTVKEITNYGIEFKDDSEVEFDAVIWCGGLEASQLVKDAFNCGSKGLEVNRGLSAPEFDGVYAAGASADIERTDFYGRARQGKLIADNITSDTEILKQYKPSGYRTLDIGNTGLLISGDKAYLNRLIPLISRYRSRKYSLNLGKQKIF